MTEAYVATDIEGSITKIDDRLRSLDGCQRFIARVNGKPVCHTYMQALFNLRFDRQLDRKIYEVMITHATAAERLGAGGFARCLELVHERLKGQGLSSERPAANHAWRTDVDRIVTRYASPGGPRVIAMLREALHLAGFTGRIIIEKTSSSVPSVELVRGYTFDLKQLLPIDFSFIRPRVACIDGYVEEVAEIHHLLEAAAGAREPCVLFIRGASDDVKHTLKVNYDRGSLRVVPIGVRFDLEGMNTLVDLATATGANLVSSLKGELISTIKFDELPRVDQVTMFKGRTVVSVTRSQKAVKDHVANLRRRRAEERVDDVASLLDKRIKSLSPNHVIIRLPDDKDFVTSSQAIDYTLRAIRAAIDHGVDADGNLIATELAARHHADRCVRTLKDLGACLF